MIVNCNNCTILYNLNSHNNPHTDEIKEQYVDRANTYIMIWTKITYNIILVFP